MKTELTNLIIQLRYDRIKRSKKTQKPTFDQGLSKLGITSPTVKENEKVTCKA